MGRNFGHNNRGRGGFRPSQGRGRGDYGRGGFSSHGESRGRGRNEKGFHGNRGRGHSPPRRPANYREEEHMRDRNLSREREDLRAQRSENRFEEGYRVSVQQGRGTSPHRFDRRGASHTQHRGGGDKARGARPVQDEIDVQSDLLYGDEGVDITPTKWGKSSRSPSREMDMFREKSATPSRSPQRQDRAQSQDSSFGSKPVLERLGGFVEEPQRPAFPDQSIRITVGNDICLKQGRGQATSRLGPPVDAVSPSPERRFRRSESSSPPDKRRRSRSRSYSPEGERWRHSRSRSYSTQRSQSRGRSRSRSPSYRRSRSRSHSRGRSYHRRRRSCSTDSERSIDRYDKRRSHMDREHKKRKPERRGSGQRRTHSGSSERHQSENRGSLEKDRSKRESFIRNSRGLVSTKPHVLDLLENIAHGIPVSSSEADKNVEQINLNKTAAASAGVENDVIHRSITVKPENQQDYRSPLLETPSQVPSNPPEIKVKSILKNSGRDNSVHNQTNQSMFHTQNQDLYSDPLPGFNTGEKSGLGHEFLSSYSAKNTEYMKSQSDALGKAEDLQSHKASGAGYTDNPPPDGPSRPGAPLIPGLGDINVEDEDEFLYGDLDQQPAESKSSQPVETHMIPPEEAKVEKPHEAKDTESNPLLENVLKSIGFNFELSKIMQEKAQKDRVASAPRKDPPPDPFGINQAASFLGRGGLTHVDFGSVFDPGSVQGKLQPAGQQVQQKGTKRKILESVSAESYEQKAKRYLEEQAKRYISGESEFEHKETHSQHGALADVGRYSARRLPDVDPFSLSPKGNESHMVSSDPYQERPMSNAPYNDPYQERTGDSVPHDDPYIGQTEFGQNKRDKIPRSDSYEKRYQHVTERHSPISDEMSAGRRSRLSESSSAGWDRPSSRDSCNERSLETQQFGKRLDSSYRSPSPPHTDYRRYQGSTEHYQDRQTRTDKLQSDPNAVTKQKSRQGDPDKNTTRHIFPICDSADGKEYRQYDRDKSKTRPLSREIYKMSPKEIRSPREDLYRQSPREETYRLSSREEEVYKQSPKDEPYKQSHREEVYKQSPREEIYKQSSRTDMFKQSPREELYKHSPREEVSKQSPKEELYKQSPREDLYKQSARMMYKQTKQPQKDAYRQSPKEMYKQSPRDQWDEEPAQSATKPSRSFRHSDKVMGERGAQKKKYSKNERPSDRDRVDDISYRDKEWHGRQSWERSPEKEEQFQEVKEKITRPLVKIEFKGTTQPPQKKTKRSGEHLEEEHDIHEQRIVKNLTSERSRQMEISETRASRSPRDSMPAVKMKPIGSPSNTSRGFIDSPQVKGDLQVKELYKQSISSNQESRRTVVPPSRESKKSEPKETRNVSIIIRKPLNLPKPSTFYDSDSDDLLSEVEKARLLHESKERQNRLASLEKELAILKRQQNELMRKRQRQKYGHRDPVLMQNNRLQEKVASQISKLRKEAEGKERELLKKFSVPAKKQVSPKGTSDDKSPIHKMKEMKKGTFDKVSKDKPPKEEKKTQPLQVDPKGSDSKPEEKKDNKAVLEVEKTGDKKAEKKSKKMEIQYQCYDQGNHWCPSCNVLSSTLYNLFEHLHGKKHVQNMDQYDRPWMPDSLKQSKKSAETKGMKALVCPVKGTEFMMPIKGFYCKLCKEFSGDETCGVEHLKSKTHNENYAKYIEDNLFYEERLNLDRAAGMAVRRSEEEKEKAETKEEKAAQKKKLQTEKTEKARQRNLELIKKEQIESENIEDLGDCAIPEPVTLGTASHSSQTQGQDKQGDGTREVSKLGRKSISIKLSGPSKVTIGKNALQIGNKGKKDIRPVSKPVEIMPMKRFRKPKPLGAEKIDEIKAEEDPMETGSVDSFFTIGKGNDSIALPVMQDAVKNETNLQKVSEKGAKDPENSASFSSVTDPKVDTKIDYLSSEPPAPGTCEDKRSSADKTERTAEKETAEVQSLNQIDLSQVPLPPGPCLAASNSKPTTNMATTSAGNLYSVFFSNSMKDSASEPILPKSTTDNLKVSVPELSVPELPPPRTSDIAVMETRSSDDEDKTETGNKMAFENISVQESKVVQQQDSKITGADTCELSASQSCQNKSSTSDGEISVQEKSAGVQQIHIGNIKSGQSVEILKECVDIPLPEPILHSASNEQHAMQNTKIIKQELTFDSCTQSAGCAAADKEIAPGHESSETVSCKENCDSHCSKTTAVVTANELQIQQLHSEITPSLTAETLFLDSSTNTAVSCSLTTQEPVEMDVEGGSNIEESCSLTTPVPAHEPGEMDIEDTQMIEGQTFTSSSVSKDTNDKESSVSNECSFGNNTNPQHAISAVDSSQQTASPAEEGSTPGETSVKQSPSHESNSISIDFTFKDLPEEKANSGLDSEKDIVTENPSKPETCSVIEGQRIELQICAPEAISISKTNIHELAREGECKTPQQSIGSVGAVFDNLVQGTCSGEEGNCLTVQNPEKTTESEEPPTEVTCSASGFPSQTLVQEVSSVSENSPVSKPGSGSKNENINSASEDLVSQPEIKSLSLEPSSNSARDIESVKVPAHERSRISERDSVRKELSDKAPPIVLKDHSTIKAPEPGPASYCGDCSVTDAPENESSIVSGESSVIQTNAEGPNDQAQDEQCSVNASQSDTYKAAIGQIVKNLTSEVAEYETAQSQKETASFPENTPADLAQSATDQIGVQSESKLVSESEAAAADLSQEPLSQFEDPGFGSAPLTNEDSLDQITEKQVSEVLGLLSSLDEAAVDSGYIAACSAGTSVTEQQSTGQEPQQGEGERSTSDRSDPIQNPAIVATELPEQIFQPETTVEMAIGRDIIDDQQESRMA